MDLEDLRQLTYDSKAERHRIGYKRTLALIGGCALWGISTVVGVGVYLATHNGSSGIIAAFCSFLVLGITYFFQSKAMAKKSVPCGSCHKPMVPFDVPYLNATSDFSLCESDKKAGIEDFTAGDGRTYIYIPNRHVSGGSESRTIQSDTFSPTKSDMYAPSEPRIGRYAIPGTYLLQQQWFVCQRCQRGFISAKFAFKRQSLEKTFGKHQATAKVKQRLSGKKIRFKKG